MYQLYEKYLATLQTKNIYRSLNELWSESNIDYVDFSTNDYLSLSKQHKIKEKAIAAIEREGVGSTGSRLLSGNSKLAMKFEKQIAKDKNTEAALIFSSGFQANYSCLNSLLDVKVLQNSPIVFFDKMNHSSLYQAVLSSNATLVRYSHLDMNQLGNLLEKYKDTNQPKFIVSETIFGMDGDIVDLQQLINFAAQYDSFLYLDEAHATGVFGKCGYGMSTDYNLSGIKHLIMGTFSKAIGVCGGYVATSQIIKKYLINKATGFIYSTAMSPADTAAAYASWEAIAKLSDERHKLQENAAYLRKKLNELTFDIANSSSHIIPIIIGDDARVMEIKQELLKENILVSAIRAPTVPPKTARIRLALNIAHSRNDIDKLLQILSKWSY